MTWSMGHSLENVAASKPSEAGGTYWSWIGFAFEHGTNSMGRPGLCAAGYGYPFKRSADLTPRFAPAGEILEKAWN